MNGQNYSSGFGSGESETPGNIEKHRVALDHRQHFIGVLMEAQPALLNANIVQRFNESESFVI